MMEMHSAMRPGRPVLLTLVTAGVLVGALGLAWTQVRGARALGPRVAIAGTPLSVAPPVGWIQSSETPGVFDKVIRIQRGPLQEGFAVEQRLQFGHARLSKTMPPLEALVLVGLLNRAAQMEVGPARIGSHSGIEVRVVKPDVIQGRRVLRIRLLRAATLPSGDLVFIDYQPLVNVTLGDLTLLEDVAAAVRVEDRAGVNTRAARVCDTPK